MNSLVCHTSVLQWSNACDVQGLDALLKDLGGDLSVLGTTAQINDVFSTSILTTKVMLEQMQDGQKLTTMNGNTVTVSITT